MDTGNIGKQIAKIRKEKGLTQKQLGEMLSVSDKTVSRWERGDTVPDIYILADIARQFEITIDELAGHKKSEDTNGEIQSESDNRIVTEKCDCEKRGKKYILTAKAISISTVVIAFLVTFLLSFAGYYSVPFIISLCLIGAGVIADVVLFLVFFIKTQERKTDRITFIKKYINNFMLLLSGTGLLLPPVISHCVGLIYFAPDTQAVASVLLYMMYSSMPFDSYYATVFEWVIYGTAAFALIYSFCLLIKGLVLIMLKRHPTL